MIRKNPKILIGGIVLLMVLLVSSIFTTGCEKEEEICAIFVAMLQDGWQMSTLTADPYPNSAESEVVIEWDTLSHIFPNVYWDLDGIYFHDTLDLDTLEDYTVELTSDVGKCEGTVTLPGGTSIIEPEYNDTLPLGVVVTVDWSTAQEADYYYVWYELDAYDSTGSFIEWDDTFRFVTPSSFSIPAGDFDTPDAAYYWVYFDVSPFSGAMPVAGETGNMSGSVHGFLTAVNFYGDYTIFWVGEPVKKDIKTAADIKRPTEKTLMNAYLKTLGIDKVIQ